MESIPDSPLSSGGVAIIVVNSVFLILAITAVILRFYARYISKKRLDVDDYLIVAGLIFTIATVGVGYALSLDGGAGVHTKDASPKQIATALKLFVPAPLLWSFATTFVKVSILYWYITIFTLEKMRKAVYTVIALSVTLLVVVLLESFLLCRPFEFTWNKEIDGVCGDSTKAYLSVAIVNLVIDMSIVALPMPVLWHLQMPIRRKLAVTLLLCLGLCICVMSAVRIKCILDLAPLDFTYTIVNDTIFGGLEIELGIINACLPILRPLFGKVFAATSAGFTSAWSKQSNLNSSGRKNTWTSQSHRVEPNKFHRLGNGTDSALEMGGYPKGTNFESVEEQ